MKNQIIITYIEDVASETFYHVEAENNIYYKSTLLELALQGKDIVLAESVAEEYGIVELNYVEVAHDYSGENKVIDVYEHFVIINMYETKVNYTDEMLKTYKQEKSAMNFAKSLKSIKVVVN